MRTRLRLEALEPRDMLTARLVADFNQAADSTDPQHMTVVGDVAYFFSQGTDRTHLWKTDATARTELVFEFSSRLRTPFPPVIRGTDFLFLAGRDLWVSDGSTDGTKLIHRDIDANEAKMAVHGDQVFINVERGSGDQQLWVTGGDASSTVLLKEFTGEPPRANEDDSQTVFQSELYFVANDGIHGLELWKSDGTTAGTTLVADISEGASSSSPQQLTVFADQLIFTARTQFGRELWTTRGTPETTAMIIDLAPGSGSGLNSEISPEFIERDGLLYFLGQDDVSGRGIWQTDGTADGTETYHIELSEEQRYTVDNLSPLADGFLFTAFQPRSLSRTLWFSNGTAGGTRQLLAEGVPFFFNSLRSRSTLSTGERFYFNAETDEAGFEPWTTDGTVAGTKMLRDISPGVDNSGARDFVRFQDEVFFSASSPDGRELWKTDGTSTGTTMVIDLNTATLDSSPVIHGSVNNRLLLSHGGIDFQDWGLRSLNPVDSTFTLVKAGIRGFEFSPPGPQSLANDEIYFLAEFQDVSTLFRTDGTPSGTRSLSSRGLHANLTRFGSEQLVFRRSERGQANQQKEMWISGGTLESTREVAGDYGAVNTLGGVAVVDDTFFFMVGDDRAQPLELWKSKNGDTAERVVELSPVSRNLTIAAMVRHGSEVLFGTSSRSDGGLWRSDGTAAGTVQFDPVRVFGDQLVPFQGGFYFHGGGEQGRGLWRTDGTNAGTRLIKEVVVQQPQSREAIVVAGDRLYFVGKDDSPTGYELWVSDGTTEGTRMVKNIAQGAHSADITELKAAGDQLFFSTSDWVSGFELWTTDGTTDGTRIVDDIFPGRDGSHPDQLTVLGDTLYFVARGPTVGRELFSLPISPLRLTGDLDLNGLVDIVDFGILSANFGRNDATYVNGDLNGDRRIAFDDFLKFAAQFGRRLEAATPSSLVARDVAFALLADQDLNPLAQTSTAQSPTNTSGQGAGSGTETEDTT